MEETERLRQEAISLLLKYDRLKAELAQVSHDLSKACVAYGRSQGYYFTFTKEQLRREATR